MSEPYRKPPGPKPLAIDSKNGGDQPNYIIFMPDQLRYDSLGCTADGKSKINTLNIDAFR
jgi:arylsulfatase A-like enzyme